MLAPKVATCGEFQRPYVIPVGPECVQIRSAHQLAERETDDAAGVRDVRLGDRRDDRLAASDVWHWLLPDDFREGRAVRVYAAALRPTQAHRFGAVSLTEGIAQSGRCTTR